MCGANPESQATGDFSITGTVLVGGVPKPGAYVRLLDGSGDFVAETPTSRAGTFAFFAAPGEWTVRLILPGGSIDRKIVLFEPGGVTCDIAA